MLLQQDTWLSEKHQVVEQSMESKEKKKWVITGISSWPPLGRINTKQSSKNRDHGDEGEGGGEDEPCRATTPTTKESRIPESLPCPPAPRKGRPPLRCQKAGAGVEFFYPPDLETVFLHRPERAK